MAWLQASAKRALAPSTQQPTRSNRQRGPIQIPHLDQCRSISTRQPTVLEPCGPSFGKRDLKSQILQGGPSTQAHRHVPYIPIQGRPGEEATPRQSQCTYAWCRTRSRRNRLQLHIQRQGRGRERRWLPAESRIANSKETKCPQVRTSK